MVRKKCITSGRLLPKVRDIRIIRVDGIETQVSITLRVDRVEINI